MERPSGWFPRTLEDLNEEERDKIRLLKEGIAKPYIKPTHYDVSLARLSSILCY